MSGERAIREERNRGRLRALVVGGALLAGAALGGALPSAPASAIPPFPIVDDTQGTPGDTNPNWESVVTGAGATGNIYTSDGWLRLTNSGTNQATNILNDTAFPSTTGFVVDFDYRQAGGTTHSGDGLPARTGDGLSMYLVDGDAPVSAGGFGGGLGYAGMETTCGVEGGYAGVGFDIYGSFAAPSANSSGGPGTSPSTLGVRGSGTPPCATPDGNYPWVDGTTVDRLWTGVPGSAVDPALQADSLYRHVRILVVPSGGAVTLSVALSAPAPKDEPYGSLVQTLSVDLSTVATQTPLPPTLKLGFGASTGGATDYHDIRRVQVTAFTDASITKTLSAATPGNPALPAGQFLPGDPIAFTITATNGGPTEIGYAPTGVARVFDDLSALGLTGVAWTCTGSGGGVCLTPAGTGPVVLADWTAPAGGSVTVEVSGTIPLQGLTGAQTNTAVIPTDFASNTVGPSGSPVQQDGATVDSDTSNNAATARFIVARPFFASAKSASASAYAVGQPVTYTAVITGGPTPGTAAFTDTVPSAVQVTGATCTTTLGGTCTVAATGNDISGTLAIQAGEVAIVTISGTAVAVGPADNTIVVTPTDPWCATGCGGGPATTAPTAVVPTALTLTKTALSNGRPVTELSLGMPVDYLFEVVNSGQFLLEDVTVDELSFTGSGDLTPLVCPQTTLQAGERMTCTASYAVTQADLDGGLIVNTARASGNAPGSDVTTISPVASLSLPVPASPALSLAKTARVTDANASGRIDVGDTVVWTFTATNTGDITLHQLTIDDPAAGLIRCDAVTLAPGAAVGCTSLPYTITVADALRGSVVNTARATATDPRGGTVASASVTATVPVTAPGETTETTGGGLAATGSTVGSAPGTAAALALLAVAAGTLLRRRTGRRA